MNIAHLAPHSVTLPLAVHNGRYDWMLQLARQQVQAGHKVTIYCNPASALEDIKTVGITAASDDRRNNNLDTFDLALRNNHDLYHSHFDNLHYEVANPTNAPIVFTQHWWPQEETIRLSAASRTSNIWAVPPTKYMYEFDLSAGIATKGHIYHGIDLNRFSASAKSSNDRLLFVGRVSPEKNLPLAITVARQAGLGLDIIGKIVPKNQPYWESLQSQVDGKQIRYLGSMSAQELAAYYAKARALIFPSDVNEAFGLAAIESQACGTPVIMQRGGSRGELIEEGKTGFLCESEREFIEAARAASNVQAADCISFAQRFDIRSMSQEYETLYASLLA